MIDTNVRGGVCGVLWRSEWKKFGNGDFWMGKKEVIGEWRC